MTTPVPETSAAPVRYKDDDLVYVDPDTKSVVGFVEWTSNGEKPLSKTFVPAKTTVVKGGKEERRSFWRKVYPWGTYRSMKRIFKVEGKIKDAEPNKTLDEVLPKALNEAFWKW